MILISSVPAPYVSVRPAWLMKSKLTVPSVCSVMFLMGFPVFSPLCHIDAGELVSVNSLLPVVPGHASPASVSVPVFPSAAMSFTCSYLELEVFTLFDAHSPAS